MSVDKITYYNDLDLPVERWFLMNQILLRKVGIGNDLEAFRQHFENLSGLLEAENYKVLGIELQNTFLNAQAIMTKENWDVELYALFVRSIDGKEITINTMADLENIIKLLPVAGIGIMKLKFNEIKKKLRNSLNYFFRIWMRLKFTK